jgi:hypothetical protein
MRRLLAGLAVALAFAVAVARCDKDIHLGTAPSADAADDGAAGDAGTGGD